MKLPRWMVIGMLTSSVLSGLAASGWWWVTWPERTARQFVDRLAAGEDDKARLMIGKESHLNDPLPNSIPLLRRPNDWSVVRPRTRSLLDIILARHHFKITQGFGWEFFVERGSIEEVQLDAIFGDFDGLADRSAVVYP